MTISKANGSANGAAANDDEGEVELPLRISRSRARMSDWSLVLDSAAIPHRWIPGTAGFELWVAPIDRTRAGQTLDAYDRENPRPSRVAFLLSAEAYGRSSVGIVTALLLMGFYVVTGPSDGASTWSRLGSAAAERILHGELWRSATALTLHADPAHVLGNCLACVVFLTFLGNRLGPGLAIWLTLLSGVLGNLLTAVVTGDHHVAVGASTATFGALGALVGLRVVSPRGTASRQPMWTVLAAALALLGMLGTSPGADVLAHFFGLACGAVLGSIVAVALPPLRRQWPQALLAASAACAIAVSWALAFRFGRPI
jgi:membrane associated rhomboid family serine protease